MSSTRFAIVGAGNGGQAFAGHLASIDHEVSLFDVDPVRVTELQARGAIELDGAIEGSGRPRVITTDIGAALDAANVVMVVVPACYQESLAARMAPHLKAGQCVVLNPGATGGALAVREVFRAHGVSDGVSVSETATLLYACRARAPGSVHIFAVKERVDVSTLPARSSADVLERLDEPFPSLMPVPSVLHTSFGNLNPVVHPGPTLLNAGRIETGQSFQFYREGMTPAITEIVEALDAERLAIARAYGVEAESITGSLRLFYGAKEQSLYEIFRNSRAHDGVMSPPSVDTRYLFEDVPTGLVPLAELAAAARVAAPAMKAIADLACVVSGRDFWNEGRTLDRLGLAGLTVDQIRRAVA